jgi:CubicO group peptidase (beta-lactamase class C family)
MKTRPIVMFVLFAAVVCGGLALASSGPAVSAAAGSGFRTLGAPARPAPSSPAVLPPDLDAVVARAMKTFDVPGVAVAVVKDGHVVLAKGYGVRKLGDPAPVDPQTLFGIASNTKAFTATALGLLVEDGKLDWDGQVTRYIPWFQMYDPYVTREMTVRDLLVHRSGIGAFSGDLLIWPQSTYSRREIVGRLRFLRPAASFRSTYAYDNILYLAAGEVIQAASGLAWEDFVSQRIFAKAGMTASRPRHSAAAASAAGANVALPHAVLDRGLTPVAVEENDNTNPAGGILSCADDMAKWMLIHLAQGQLPDGTRLFSERTERQLTSFVTPIPISDPEPELAAQRANFYGYALGFRVSDYRGRRLVGHTGSLTGYVSRVIMVPEIGFGVAVLTNQSATEAYNSIALTVLDQALGAPRTDWVTAYAKVRDRSRAETAAALKNEAEKRDASLRPTLPLAAYAGAYEDAWYGPIDIKVEGTGAGEAAHLVMSFAKTPGMSGPLEPWSRETFIFRFSDRGDPGDAFATFVLDADGSIVEVRMKAFSPDTDDSLDYKDLLIKPVKR